MTKGLLLEKQKASSKVLYRGVSKHNQSKIIIIAQAETSVISNHIQENVVRFVENGALMYTAVLNSYNEGWSSHSPIKLPLKGVDL